MGLADYQPRQESVSFPGGSVDLKGLSVSDFGFIMRVHLADIEAIRKMVREELIQSSPAVNLENVAGRLFNQAPLIVCTAIATAAGEPENCGVIMEMPAGVQMEMLAKVLSLTFDGMDGLKNTVAAAQNMYAEMFPNGRTGTLQDGVGTSNNGTGTSEPPSA